MKKFDFKNIYKEIYKTKLTKIVEFPTAKYITIFGEGSPDSDVFLNSIQALYPIAYTISMSYKSDFNIDGFYNFVVPPLEGIWDVIVPPYTGDKDNLKWTIMLMMPNFVTTEVFLEAQNRAFKKTNNKFIKNVSLITSSRKKCCVSLHIGPYDNEKISFDKMQKDIMDSGYKRSCLTHREIYLSDFRKTDKEKLKTLLCFDVLETE